MVLGGGYGVFIEPERLTVERVVTRLRGLPTGLEGLRIVVLSDFHLHPYTKIGHVQDAVHLANSLKPDLVVLLGDYVYVTQGVWLEDRRG